MLINNTVLGNAPFRTTLVVVSVFLTFLFTMMEPHSSQGLSFFPRLLFWLLQVATGMVGIVVASLLLRRISNRDFHLIVLLGITGTVGTLLAAPAFLLIDSWFPGVVEEPDSWIDEFAFQGPVQAILSEFLSVLPPLLTSWYIVNLPLLLNATFVKPSPPDDPAPPEDAESLARNKLKEQFYSRLPTVIGNNIVSISSDLHYLNVTTTLGNSLILGSLSQVAEAFEEEGFLVHRSHWVHKNHVVKVYIAGNEAYCIMTNDAHIPISRSKRKLVKSYFGQTSRLAEKSEPVQLKQVK